VTNVDLTALIKEHDWDELIFGGFVCLTCSPDEGDDPDVVAWPCPALRAAGMTDAHAVAHIENDRLRAKVERWRVELRDKGNDLLDIRGILWPNGMPSRAPDPEDVSVVAPSVQWLVDEVERLTAQLDKPCGSCHPCVNYADETWRAAGRTPPHVFTYDREKAVVQAAREHVAAVDNSPAHTRVTLAVLTSAVNALDGGEQS
jgi:hypothetical protein